MPAGNTFTPITSQTLTSSTGTINLSSFSGYTDLRIVLSYLTDAPAAGPLITFNGSSGPYEQITIAIFGENNSSKTYAVSNYSQSFAYLYATRSINSTTQPGVIIIDLPYYANTDTFHYMFNTNGVTQAGANQLSLVEEALQTSIEFTSAITTAQITLGNTAVFTSGTTISVYGILEA